MSCGFGSNRDAKAISSPCSATAPDFAGSKRYVLIKTGERTYCVIGEWDSLASIVAARPNMIATLDTFRDMLEDLGGGLGVTDPVSGEVILEK
jgi:hypothetical protein